jgi:hypothetical protein
LEVALAFPGSNYRSRLAGTVALIVGAVSLLVIAPRILEWNPLQGSGAPRDLDAFAPLESIPERIAPKRTL